jgi:hypothetical protein
LNPEQLDLRCLSATSVLLSELFSGNHSRTQGLFPCVDRALLAFSSHTRGENPGYYTLPELRSFINRHLPPEEAISPAFARALFQMKRTLSGGEPERIRSAEIEGLRRKISRLGALLSPLSPHLPVLIRPEATGLEERRRAGIALAAFIDGITELLSESAAPLPWSGLQELLRELDSFVRKTDDSILPWLVEQIPIFQCLKLMLVGGDESAIEVVKWGPILRSISHFYGTLLLTRNPPELLEQLSLEVVSTPEEQARAATRLTALLRTLVRDPGLRSSSLLKTFADRYAKALLLNALVFPETEGSLALRPFLGTLTLRRLTGRLIVESVRAAGAPVPEDRWQLLVDQAASLIEQASLSGGTANGPAVQLSLQRVNRFFEQIEPLLDPSGKPERIRNALRLLEKAIPLVIGKDASTLSAADLRAFLQKTLELAMLWRRHETTPGLELLKKGAEILSRHPRAVVIPLAGVQELLALSAPWTAGYDLDVPALLEKFRNFLRLKALLLGGPEEGLGGGEVDQLAYLLQAFRPEDGTAKGLVALSNLLRNRPLHSSELTALMLILDPLLPEAARRWLRNSSGQLRLESIGRWKALAVGGDPGRILSPELADLSRLAGLALQALPPGFNPGINAETASRAAALLRALRDNRRESIHLPLLRDVLQDIGSLFRPRIRRDSIELLLAGVHTRLIRNLRGPKPRSLEGLAISPADLDPWIRLLSGIATDLQALDPAPQEDESRLRAALLPLLSFVFSHYSAGGESRLPVADLQDLLEDLNPIAFDLGLTWGYSPALISAPLRRKTMDLFTGPANGNGFVEPGEAVDFLMLARPGKRILDQAVREVLSRCLPGVVEENIRGIPSQCLSNHLFRPESLEALYGRSFPALLAEVGARGAEGIHVLQKSMVASVEPADPDLLDRSDFESLVSLPIFLEKLFVRYDASTDGTLVFSEAMNAFPVFCDEIRLAAGRGIRGGCAPGQDPGQIEAIFGYLLFRKSKPRGIRPEDPLWTRYRSARELFAWFRFWNQLDRTPEQRDALPPSLSRLDLLEIMSNLSTSPPKGLPDNP